MKNPCLLTNAMLSIVYPATVGAELLGVLPGSVISFPTFISLFTASGVLAIAFRDYARKAPSYDTTPLAERTSPVEKPATPASLPSAGWIYHTASS